jgi:hypothetical protein
MPRVTYGTRSHAASSTTAAIPAHNRRSGTAAL